MKLKHLGLFAMLSLLTWSCSDDKSDFAGDNGTGQIAARCSADYKVAVPQGANGIPTADDATEVESISPAISDFAMSLKKSDGSYSQTWSSIGQFPTDKKFPVGAYEMSIWYGDETEEGFEKPYYYGSTTFEVVDEETVNPSIEAKLANSMVSLYYTDAFKNYFASYTAKVRTASGNVIEFANDETRPVYVKPGKVTFQLNMVKTNGVEMSLEPAAIDDAAACTHYRVTFDVNGGEVGDAVLTVTFDDATETETVEITLSEDLSVAPAPIITPKGFENGVAIDIIEGDEASASVAIVAQAGIKAVTLNTSSEYLASKGWATEIDLMAATDDQKALLVEYGLDSDHVKGLWNNPDKMAVINFAGIIPNLSPLNGNSTHKFTVQVTDSYGRVAESAAELIVNAPAVIFSLSEAQKSEAGSLEGTFTLTYNGNMDNVSFKAMNDYGNYVDAAIKSYTKTGDNTYTVTITIPDNGSKTSIKGYYKGEEKSSIDMKIGKTFTLSAEDYDIWATKATVKINTKVTDFKDVVMANLKSVWVNGTETTGYTADADNCQITVTGLTTGASNTIKVVSDDEDGDEVFATITFTTETAAQLGNAGFEEFTCTDFSYTVTLGGTKTVNWYLPWTDESTAWWDVNSRRTLRTEVTAAYQNYKCYPTVTYINSGTYEGNNAAQIATASTGSAASEWSSGSSYAGEIFIGKSNTSHQDNWGYASTGHEFPSRPSSMSFHYQYEYYKDNSFSVTIQVMASDGSVIAENTVSGEQADVSDWTQFTVPLTYTVTNKKAASIFVSFKSTTTSSPSVEKRTLSCYNGDSEKHYIGSVLRVDNIVLNY